MSNTQGTTIHIDLSGNEAIRAQLKADPRKVIEETQGISVPAGIEIRVAGETADGVSLFVPSTPAGNAVIEDITKKISNDDELSDDLLDMVSAGSSGYSCTANSKNNIQCGEPRTNV